MNLDPTEETRGQLRAVLETRPMPVGRTGVWGLVNEDIPLMARESADAAFWDGSGAKDLQLLEVRSQD